MANCPGKGLAVFVSFRFLSFFFFFFQARRAGSGSFRGSTVPSHGRRNSVTGLREENPRSLVFGAGGGGGARGRHTPMVPADATRMTVTVTRSRDRPERPPCNQHRHRHAQLPEFRPRNHSNSPGSSSTENKGDCWASDGLGSDWWVVLACVLPPCEVRASLRARRCWKFPPGTCCKLSVERPDLRGPARMPTDMPGHQGTLGRSSCPFLESPSLITSSPCPGRPAPSL